MYKFFISQKQIKDEKVKIIGEDVNHIANVLRLKKSDKIILCNKDEFESYISEITEIKKEYIECRIIEKVSETTESKVSIDLFQGLPKSDKMEYIIQKATELGVKNIYPVNFERCIVKFDKKTEIKKLDRWQKIAEVAAKQSKRDVIPTIKNIINNKKICKEAEKYDIILVAYEMEDKVTLKSILNSLNKEGMLNIGLVIGPEGGLCEKEVEELVNSGAKSVTLGKRILRTETASLMMISNIIYEFEL